MQCVFMRLPAAVQASQVLQEQTGGTTLSTELCAPGHCSVQNRASSPGKAEGSLLCKI